MPDGNKNGFFERHAAGVGQRDHTLIGLLELLLALCPKFQAGRERRIAVGVGERLLQPLKRYRCSSQALKRRLGEAQMVGDRIVAFAGLAKRAGGAVGIATDDDVEFFGRHGAMLRSCSEAFSSGPVPAGASLLHHCG